LTVGYDTVLYISLCFVKYRKQLKHIRHTTNALDFWRHQTH
jgi:hypothetical protein